MLLESISMLHADCEDSSLAIHQLLDRIRHLFDVEEAALIRWKEGLYEVVVGLVEVFAQKHID